MDVRLYIANLSAETSQQDLQAMFSEAGAVAAVEVVVDPRSGKSRGFAFVTMHSQAEAEKAVEMFNEKEVNGHILRVNITLPREGQSASGTSARSNQL